MDVKKRLFTYEGLNPDKTQVIYNGTRPLPVITPEERTVLRQRFGFKDNDIVAGFIGRLDPIKNLPLMIDGFERVKSDCPDMKGIIIGDGPLFNDLKEKIHHLKIQDEVVLAGYQPDAATLVAVMDIFILVSFSEGTSMALLEAMAAGIPAIVTDVGGNPEIVVNNQTGWIIPSDDPDAMVAALTDAVSNSSKRQKMGDTARKRFLENFSFEKMIEMYKKIYREL